MNVSTTAEAAASSSPGSYAVNCSMQADPDIAGTGVLIGFMLPTYLTLVLVTVHYISAERGNNNAVDRKFINLVRFRIWKRIDAGAWIKAMETSVLLFSDIQILTGLAILLCGYTQLPKGLSSYHWQMVISLAWFSSLTHLATLSSLRGYFLSRPAMAICRATLMGGIMVLLSVAFGTTGYVSQFDDKGDACWPAHSLFSSKGVVEDTRGKRPPFNTPLVVLSIAFLVTSYLNRVLRIFAPTASLAHSWFKVAPKRAMRNWYTEAATKVKYKPGVSRTTAKFLAALLYIVCKALYDIANSMLWEICWLLAALAWGSLRLVGLRIETPLEGEDKWGFGQILPVLLTALPLWSIISTVFEENIRARHDNQQLSTATKLDGADSHESDASQEDNIETLNVDECSWFSKLVALIFGYALVLIASLVYNFPAASINDINSWNTDRLEDPSALGFVVMQYAILLATSSLIVLMFASVCLGVHLETLSFPVPFVQNMSSSLLRRPKAQELLWDLLIVFLVISFMVLDWFVFDGHKALLFNLPSFENVNDT